MGNRLDGKVCIVTGAGQGIGRGSAIELARGGGRVAVSDRRADTGEETVRLIRDEGGEAIFIPCDVRERDQIGALVRATTDHFGGVNVIHNNAGVHETDICRTTAIWELPEEIWEQVYQVNVRSIWYMTRAALPFLKEAQGASIVNTASLSSFVAMPMSSAYCTSKGAVLMLTKAMAVDLAAFRIRVNCICPGSINTPLLQNYFTQVEDPAQKAALEKSLLGANLIPRLGEPDEVGKLVRFLASDDAAYVNGSSHMIDAGATAWRGTME